MILRIVRMNNTKRKKATREKGREAGMRRKREINRYKERER